MDIAKYEYGYESILPVGAVTQIRYLPKQNRQGRQGEKKERPFEAYFRMQLEREPQKDENQSFQAYC